MVAYSRPSEINSPSHIVAGALIGTGVGALLGPLAPVPLAHMGMGALALGATGGLIGAAIGAKHNAADRHPNSGFDTGMGTAIGAVVGAMAGAALFTGNLHHGAGVGLPTAVGIGAGGLGLIGAGIGLAVGRWANLD